MIRGVDVTVTSYADGANDRLGNPTKVPQAPVTVKDVLIVPGATEDLEAGRPEGVSVAYTLHFPKGFDADLEGCDVALPDPWGGTYRVVGKPAPYIDANTPGRWHMAAMVEEAHG